LEARYISKLFERLKIDKKIGEGAFGVVYSAELLDKDQKSTTVAVKSLRGTQFLMASK
jgi:hypothetical protein